MRKGGWSYADAGSSSSGEMKCVACSQHITAGEYRYRQKSSKGDWYYQSQHRACSESDPVWVELDARHLQAVERVKALSRACREFQKQWPEVDELIDYIRDDDGSEGEE